MVLAQAIDSRRLNLADGPRRQNAFASKQPASQVRPCADAAAPHPAPRGRINDTVMNTRASARTARSCALCRAPLVLTLFEPSRAVPTLNHVGVTTRRRAKPQPVPAGVSVRPSLGSNLCYECSCSWPLSGLPCWRCRRPAPRGLAVSTSRTFRSRPAASKTISPDRPGGGPRCFDRARLFSCPRLSCSKSCHGRLAPRHRRADGGLSAQGPCPFSSMASPSGAC
jgi:hypothetical protein